MATDPIALEALRNRAAEGLQAMHDGPEQLRLAVAPEVLHPVCLLLRGEIALAFDYPADLTADDHGDQLSLWYRFWSESRRMTAIVDVRVPRENPRLASVADIWPGMNWHERECYDMFGIEFDGHPDAGEPSQMRILLPKNWVGFPFRHDYAPVFDGDPLHGPQETN